MNKIAKTILSILLFASFLGIAYFAYTSLSENYSINEDIKSGDIKDKSKDEASEKEIKALDFLVYDKSGNKIKFSEIMSKPVVLNFWASWCPPCKSEMPHFEKIYNEYKNDIDFMMVDLTDGQRETVDTALKYIKGEGYTFPVYFDKDQNAANVYNITSIPTTVFINADGNILKIYHGALSEKVLIEEINLIKR